MPITSAAIKAARQSLKRHDRLVPYKTRMKTMVKKLRDLAKEGKKDDARKLLPEVYKAIDIATKKNLLHRNTAARRKAMVAKLAA
ncbi:MAG: small subunit ribosomal protein S20 [Candidatus Peregrinibacteria bacterium Gr01-1014_25]|nr:MAG: small subunit ribosomal protein S20 [Candidatus Peregrinibacteria bacterium Gr01-1014_25]